MEALVAVCPPEFLVQNARISKISCQSLTNAYHHCLSFNSTSIVRECAMCQTIFDIHHCVLPNSGLEFCVRSLQNARISKMSCQSLTSACNRALFFNSTSIGREYDLYRTIWDIYPYV